MPPPPRRPADRRDPFLSGVILDAEVLDAEVLDAEVLDAEVLDAEVLDAAVVDAEVLSLDDDPADDDPVFELDILDDSPLASTAPAPALPVYQIASADALSAGADALQLDADPPRPAARTASHPATATRPAVRITFVCPGEKSPFDPRG